MEQHQCLKTDKEMDGTKSSSLHNETHRAKCHHSSNLRFICDGVASLTDENEILRLVSFG